MADRKEFASGSTRRRISALLDINRYTTSVNPENSKVQLQQRIRESADLFRNEVDLGGEEAMNVKYDCDVLYLRGGKAFSAVSTSLSSTGILVDYNSHIGIGEKLVF